MTQEIVHPVFADLLTGEGIGIPQLLHYQTLIKVTSSTTMAYQHQNRVIQESLASLWLPLWSRKVTAGMIQPDRVPLSWLRRTSTSWSQLSHLLSPLIWSLDRLFFFSFESGRCNNLIHLLRGETQRFIFYLIAMDLRLGLPTFAG